MKVMFAPIVSKYRCSNAGRSTQQGAGSERVKQQSASNFKCKYHK